MGKTILIAGGGTGGHVLPALAIANSIKSFDSSASIHFVGTSKGIETKLVPKEGYPLHLLTVSGLKNASFTSRLRSLIQLPSAFFKSALLLSKLKPDRVLGVGGYASGPLVFVASIFGYRTFIWEPNAHPGWTNRLLSRFVGTAFVVFDASRSYLATKNIISMGMPLRKSIGHSPRTASAKLRVLVFGGSQGARGINTTVTDALTQKNRNDSDWKDKIEIVHQTGALDFENVRQKYSSAGVNIEVHPFLYDMEKRYAWADLVICRSGASTVAEIAASKKAAVFIPFPFAADDHQKKNAESLAREGAALLVVQKDFTPQKFISILQDFLAHPEKTESMEAKVAKFHRPNASDEIARIILN